MNWNHFLLALIVIMNITGSTVFLWHLVDYSSWTNKEYHKTQRNFLIAGIVAFALEIAIGVGMTT